MKFTEPVYDVSGDSVDIGRYLAGEPECMMDWPLQPTSAAGRVITLCASICYSGSIDAEVIIRRGQVITALALALSRLGHNVEMWADISAMQVGRGAQSRFRILVKGADDTLDPARIMYAYAHPTMLRRLGFAVQCSQPGEFRSLNPDNLAPRPPL